MPKMITPQTGKAAPTELSGAITFQEFVAIYQEDMAARLKPSTLSGKNRIIRDKILPYFGPLPMCRITVQHVRKWQAIILKQNYSPAHQRLIDMQLSAILNYGERYYGFPNPCHKAGHIGRQNAREMSFWTLDEYERFIATFSNDEEAFTAFEILDWAGLRQGELLALTCADIDLEQGFIDVNKSWAHIDGKDVITTPKTPKSIRKVGIPPFLVAEIDHYIKLAKLSPSSRLFDRDYYFLYRRLCSGCKHSGVKRIRIHDLRHSHVSLLINKGFSALDIAERVGHESVSTTLDVYSHLFPDQQQLLVDKLEQLNRQSQKISQGRKKAKLVQ